MLAGAGADIDATDADGRTSLHCALEGNEASMPVVQTLLSLGVNF